MNTHKWISGRSLEWDILGLPSTEAARPVQCIQCGAEFVPAELDKLRLFAGLVLHEHRRDMCDVEGGDIQDFATRAGLLDPVEVTERCGDGCVCAEYGSFPMICYRETPLGTAVLEALP
jgi:hypothetical protein